MEQLLTTETPQRASGPSSPERHDRAYRQLVEQARDVIYFCDRIGRVTFANEAASALLGYSRDELIGRHCLEFVHPSHREDIRSFYVRALHDKSEGTYTEVPAITKNGGLVWLSQYLQPRVEGGEVTGVQAIAHDITDRVRIQNDLTESEQRLQLLYELTSRRSTDLGDQIEEALKTTTQLLGMDVGMLSRIEGSRYAVEFCYAPEVDHAPGGVYELGHSYCSISLTANDLLAISHTRLPKKQRHPCSGLFNIESYVGLPIYVYDELYGTLNFSGCEPRSEPFTKQDKDFIRMLGAWISSALENRKTLTDLTASEKKYRSSFDYAAIGKAHVSRDGKWLQVNDALCRIVGYSEEELLGTSFQDITHPEDLDLDLAYVKRMLARRISSYSIEKRYLKKDGSIVWVLLTVSAAYDDADEVGYFVSEVQDISAQKELEHQLIQQAQHDSLTGLANRNVFMARLSEELAWCRNDRANMLAVLFMDFDRFKMVNDSLGHTSGDRLLVIVAERIETTLSDGNLFARLGGDEFGVLLPGVSGADEAAEVAERIQQALRDPIEIKSHEVFPAASIGIVITDGNYEQPEDVLRDADTAMYRAKETEGVHYRIFSEEMHVQAAERLRMDSELRRAVDNEEFEPYYQPIVDLSNGQLVGFEALARWRHPVKGMVSPATFIPHAEEIGLVKEIDRQVIWAACRQLRSWRDVTGENGAMVMHVNCSAHHLLDASFADHISNVLRETGLDPSSLVVELTESVFIEDLERAAEEIQRLKAHGVDMCIDDFGTGYSSLYALHTLPIDALKIDREFLANLSKQGRRKRIVHTVLDVAKRLEMTVVAEGVEERYQLAALRELNCPFGQGFLFAKPLTATDAQKLITKPAPWRRLWR